MAEELAINVRGSRGDIYSVHVSKGDAGKLRLTCTCEAGRNRRQCHHRIELLDGEFGAVMDAGQLPALRRLLAESSLAGEIEVLRAAEQAADVAAAKVRALRRKLGKSMDG